MKIFVVTNNRGDVLKVTKNYSTAVEYLCKEFLNLHPLFIPPVIEVFIKAGSEQFKALWEGFDKAFYYIKEFEVEN